MSPLEALANRLDAYPDVVSSDLDAVQAFIDAAAEVFSAIRCDVFVRLAAMELHNATGYPVGHIVFDSEAELYRFIPHSDDQSKET